jgi:hypothetical protein
MHRSGLAFVALELGMPTTTLQLAVRCDPPATAAQLLACARDVATPHSP